VCTILLAWRCLDAAPILLAANRDELVARPSAGPGVLAEGPPRIVGGRDLVAGGTWLAVSPDGRVGAVTNRQAGERDPRRRSRGELPLLVLGERDDAAAHSRIAALRPLEYNPFNVLYASSGRAVVGHGDGEGDIRLAELEPGPHVLTTVDLDDLTNVKVAAISGRLRAAVDACADDPASLLAAMEDILRDHGGTDRTGIDAVCIHGDVYGTVSAATVVVAKDGTISYRHAAGQPCVTPFVEVDLL